MPFPVRAFFAIVLVWLSAAPALAQTLGNMPPPADSVFKLGVARAEDGGLALRWTIASGNYLYRAKIAVTTDKGKAIPIKTEKGDIKDDPTFGRTEVYHNGTIATIAAADLPATGDIDVTFQGCADAGVCYPPLTKTVDPKTLTIAASGGFGLLAAAPKADALSLPDESLPAQSAPAPSQSTIALPRWTTSLDQNTAKTQGAPSSAAGPVATVGEEVASLPPPSTGNTESPAGAAAASASPFGGNLFLVLAGFFGAGLLLAFTPCVFPMIPILSGILAGAGSRMSAGRGFVLSSSYVVAMAFAYALVGAASAWGGLNLQIVLQNPLTLGVMAAVFVVLALSMYGLFELELPSSWTARLSRATQDKGGSVGGAAILGFVSALVVGPCMTPALAGALIYVAQTGDLLRGATALFVMGLGIGVPLILFGTFGGRILPKAGNWLITVRQATSFVFLGLAIWMLARVIPDAASLALSGLLAVLFGIWLASLMVKRTGFELMRLLPPMAGGAAIFAGLTLVVMAAMPGTFVGLVPARTAPIAASAGFSRTVTTPAEFDTALRAAQADGRPILVDFTAKWCISCKEIDANVFSDPTIRERLAGVSVIRADLSDFNAKGQALMTRFGVAGPPTMFFLDPANAREYADARSIGPIDKTQFLRLLDRVGA